MIRFLAAFLVGSSLVAGCALRPARPVAFGAEGESVADPFAPATLQIHGLSRVDRDAESTIWIICHIELKDAWGDTTKGIGQLQVQLYRPSGTGIGTQEVKWDVSLTDLEQNAALFDAATRTYRLQLEGAPPWVAGEPGRESPRVLLRAVLVTRGPAGERRVLQDEYVING